jgi:hypothetical protein
MNDVVKAEQNNVVSFNNDDSPIAAIARIAASGAGTEVVEQMMRLVEWDDARKAKAAFNSAFSKAKKNFKKAKKSGYNSHLKSNYSTLEDYDDATREALSEHGLSWRHIVKTLEGNETSVTCVLAHEYGHSEETDMKADSYSMTNNAVNKLQSVGIVEEYLRRMTLKALLGLVSDSDGATAAFDNDGVGGKEAEKITEHQSANLQAMIDETKSDKKKYLALLSTQCKRKIEKLEDIPANALKLATDMLEKKRQAQK